MTRGKHGKKSAERRAQSAEDQLDRLIPELQEAKQTARRYRAAAERVPVLEKDLQHLRLVTGPSHEEHESVIAEMKEDRELAELDLHQRYRTAIEAICSVLRKSLDLESSWLSASLCDALRELPGGYGDKALSSIGVERDFRRKILQPKTAEIISSSAHRDALNLDRAAKESGLSGIPIGWINNKDLSHDK